MFSQNFGLSRERLVVPIFWANLSNSFDLKETEVMGVFEVAEFESALKIEVTPFFGASGPIFARNLGITQEQGVVRARWYLRRVSCRVLHKDRALLRKFWKRLNLPKCPYCVRAFSRSVYLFRSIWRKRRLGVFEITEYESVLKIEVLPFLIGLGPVLHKI